MSNELTTTQAFITRRHPEMRGGMPTDRTICPSCLGNPNPTRSCAPCGSSGTVCPSCRGGIWVRLSSGAIAACPSCRDHVDAPLGSSVPFDSLKASVSNPAKRSTAIARYRRREAELQALLDDPIDGVPF